MPVSPFQVESRYKPHAFCCSCFLGTFLFVYALFSFISILAGWDPPVESSEKKDWGAFPDLYLCRDIGGFAGPDAQMIDIKTREWLRCTEDWQKTAGVSCSNGPVPTGIANYSAFGGNQFFNDCAAFYLSHLQDTGAKQSDIAFYLRFHYRGYTPEEWKKIQSWDVKDGKSPSATWLFAKSPGKPKFREGTKSVEFAPHEQTLSFFLVQTHKFPTQSIEINKEIHGEEFLFSRQVHEVFHGSVLGQGNEGSFEIFVRMRQKTVTQKLELSKGMQIFRLFSRFGGYISISTFLFGLLFVMKHKNYHTLTLMGQAEASQALVDQDEELADTEDDELVEWCR